MKFLKTIQIKYFNFKNTVFFLIASSSFLFCCKSNDHSKQKEKNNFSEFYTYIG